MIIRSLATAAVFGLAAMQSAAFAGEEVEKEGLLSDPRVGEKVDRICFQRSIDGWRTAKGFGRAVLLNRGVNDWYLVKVSGACRANDFAFAHKIGIESRPAGGCVRRGDVILVEGAGRSVNRCFIRSINRWDDDAEAPQEEDEA